MGKKNVVVFGGGPHSKVVLDLMLHSKEFDVVGVVDNIDEAPFGVPVLGKDDDMDAVKAMGVQNAFVAIGNNRIREMVSEKVITAGLELVTVIAEDAIVSEYSDIGKGVLINHGVIVNAGVSIGKGTILNTGCTVDHDCVIGQYCHIAPGTHISGSTSVGDNSFLGTGTSVIDRIVIGKNVMVGAGAAVVRDLPDNCTATGVPARIKRINEE